MRPLDSCVEQLVMGGEVAVVVHTLGGSLSVEARLVVSDKIDLLLQSAPAQ
jgi:hypothetical protein